MKTKVAPCIIRIATVPGTFSLQLSGQIAFLLQKGWDVQVVASAANEKYKWPEGVSWNRITEINMHRSISPFADIVALLKLIRLIKKKRPCIVHTHSPKAGLLGMLAAWVCRVPVRMHTLAGTPYTTAVGFTRKILWCTERLTHACSTYTWVISKGLLHQGLAAGFLTASRSHTIGAGSSNGVQLENFVNAKQELAHQELISAFPKWNGEKIWLYVGRLVHEKGIDELLPAFAALHNINPDNALVCIGPLEQERDGLTTESQQLLVKHPGILHLQWSKHIASWMKLAFCLIHPSHREGLPNVLLEAGAAGCPVLVSNIAGNRDVVVSGEMGTFFKVKHMGDLMQQMLVIHNQSPEILAQKALVLQQRVVAHFERKFMQEALHEVYKLQLAQAGLTPEIE